MEPLVYEVTFLMTVTEQHYVDGKPGFRPEMIGVPVETKSYFSSPELAETCREQWSHKPFHYQQTGMRLVSVNTLKWSDYIHCRYQAGCLVDELRNPRDWYKPAIQGLIAELPYAVGTRIFH